MKIFGVEFRKPSNFSGFTRGILVLVAVMAPMSLFIPKHLFIGMITSGVIGATFTATGVCVAYGKRELILLSVVTLTISTIVALLFV